MAPAVAAAVTRMVMTVVAAVVAMAAAVVATAGKCQTVSLSPSGDGHFTLHRATWHLKSWFPSKLPYFGEYASF